MAHPYSFFQFGDEMRGQLKPREEQTWNLPLPLKLVDDHKWNLSAEDQSWNLAAKKLAIEDHLRTNSDRSLKNDAKRTSNDAYNSSKPSRGKNKQKAETGKNDVLNKLLNLDLKLNEKAHLSSGAASVSSQSSAANNVDKRFKSLPPAETLPRNETLGGYIFVCNNDTMQEDLKRQLFGLPQRYRDSVRAIQPGLPLFLYNYTTHQLHGIFEAASFGGSNIDPTAWEDKKSKGESRFPAQVRIRIRRLCKPLEEDSFRPVLHHYDGPKFRLQLSIPETLALLDLFTEKGVM